MKQMSLSRIEPQVYEAAHTTAVLTDRSDLGVLKFTGKSRLDLINRMSTQAVLNFQSGEGAATILTTDIGRIIDRLLLYAASDSVYALTGENNADFIARYLMRFVFFNDDFQVEDLSGKTAVFGVYGPQAAAKLAVAGFPETDLLLHHWRQAAVGGVTATLHRADPIAGDGYFVMCAAADRDALWPHLLNTGLAVAGADDYEFLRIESGLPRLGHELSQDYIPLEADLWTDVSFKKGCYIGQEIIARLESRNKLAKKLVKLSPSGPVNEGDTITTAGKTAGTVTSAAAGPHGIAALGYVKTAVLEANTPLMVGEVTCER
jgi:tRNA-modifying protein YgfZ